MMAPSLVSDADEVRRNSYLLRFFSDLFIISYKYISLSMNSRGLLVEVFLSSLSYPVD